MPCTVRLIQLSAFGACACWGAGCAFCGGGFVGGFATAFDAGACGFEAGVRGIGFFVAGGGGLVAGAEGFAGEDADLVCGFTGGGAGFLAGVAFLFDQAQRSVLVRLVQLLEE